MSRATPVKSGILIYRIALATNLRRLFDYRPPETDDGGTPLQPGTRVKVPFGSRQLVGLVIESADNSEVPTERLRAISERLDREPILDPELLTLGTWASQYYQYPLGDALFALLPTLLRKGEALRPEGNLHWRLTHHGKGLPPTALGRAKKQQALLQLLQDNPLCSQEQIEAAGIARAIVRALEQKHLIEPVMCPPQAHQGSLLAEPALTLRPEQQAAVDGIPLEGFQPCLLQGATGSGKTEIYLQAIARTLDAGKQALVLIPEINLTPQTLSRFRQRFRCPLAVLHSGLTDVERLSAWQQARSGEARIVIGTRSAVFAPLAQPGIIVVDEEHDTSYKQQEGFRYSARDLAVMRASMADIPVVLGSATPSLESLHNAHQGRYRLLALDTRPEGTTAPQWQPVDIRGLRLNAGFAEPVIRAVGEQLDAGNQVLIFLNRRGYAPLLMCHDCGWSATCSACDTRMTSHRGQGRLLCHHCGQGLPLPAHCPDCRSPALQFIGQGTERGEETLASLFPQARILRIDSDTTRSKHAMANLVDDIGRGEPCILVGTQMLAKGHHFPAVTLAVLLDVDAGLFSADFRAIERMGQLITQVAGRAGRGHVQGKVMLQSHHCDHPLIRELIEAGYPRFARTLLEQRRLWDLPPFSSLALVRAEATSARRAESLLHEVRQFCEGRYPPSPTLRYLGPLASPMERRQGRYRFQLAIHADQRSTLKTLLQALCLHLEQHQAARGVRWAVDMDPQEML